ncbi:MAG TPA: YetF domain-containing protein [Gemmatimonadales bacterium]|nr:YetF domain-containing protein [Gemmatimonadales bacterium]
MLLLAVPWLVGDGALPVALRTVAVYAFALAAVRLGSKRFLSKASAFDVVVAIMLGSILSRAISSAEQFWAMLLSGGLLVAVHALLAALAWRFDWLGPLVKGEATVLVRDGQVDRDALRRTGVSEHDLEQAIRLQARRTDASQIRRATLERDGSISVIPLEREPVILDVAVADGVQTVRVRVE